MTADAAPHRHVLLVGDGELAAAIAATVEDGGATVERLTAPNDIELREALERGVSAVAVIDRDDIAALRLALVIEYVSPDVPLLVTIFDRTVAEQLQRVAPNCHVMSLADVTVPSLVGPCVSEELIALWSHGPSPAAIVSSPQGPRAVPPQQYREGRARRFAHFIGNQLRPPDRGAWLLLIGVGGLGMILVVDTALGWLVRDESFITAFYSATSTVATLAPARLIDRRPSWDQGISALMLLTSLALTAMFTAGLVDRMLGTRLAGLVGLRALPRRDHVIVVGLGQIGLRLCLELRALGVPVVAIERDPDAPNVRLAQEYRIPVVIGRGGDRFLLRRLAIGRARAIAAVTSNELENIAVVMAALAERPEVRVVLRAGGSDVVTETRLLFKIAVVRDLVGLGAACFAAMLLGVDAEWAFSDGERRFVHLVDGSVREFHGGMAAA
jgi:voltage-gated potassium channel Kch